MTNLVSLRALSFTITKYKFSTHKRNQIKKLKWIRQQMRAAK